MSVAPDLNDTPHRIVRASAGSGKTYHLTNEFMRKLFDGEQPGGILATTFTRVAAGEILHRVLQRLSSAVIDPASRAELGTALIEHDLTQERCASVLESLVSELHRLSILTIDSFFSRLAGSFSMELGLPVNYQLLEEDEDLELRQRCVDRAIDAATRSEMVELLRSMQGDRVQMQTHSAIMKAIGAGYAMYLATNGEQSPWNAIPVVGKALDPARLEVQLELLRQPELPLTKSGKPNGNWVKAHAKCLRVIGESNWTDFLTSGLGSVVLQSLESTDAPTYYKIDLPESMVTALRPIVDHARFVLSTEYNLRTAAVWMLMHRFDEVYREAKMTLGRLNFDDPPRLLNESSITGELDHLYYRLDTTLRHVMLDEFQDTSMPQFRLLEPILTELLSQNEEERSVFVVGDIKQSLYTWRQAEPKLLAGMEDRWDTLQVETLAKSYRSSPIVLDAVNAIFGDLTNNNAMNSVDAGSEGAVAWHDQYDTHQSAKESLPGYVVLSVADRDEESEPDETSEVLWSCAMRVQEARAHSSDASIAVLVRKTAHIYPLLSMLTRLGVDACENRGNPLVDAPPVAAAVSMLEVIEHPGNSAALEHVLLTPLARAIGLHRNVNAGTIASTLRDRIAREGCVPMLTQWLSACGGSMDRRGVVRFEQLIGLASKLESDGRGGAGTLAMVAQSRRIDEPGHAPVRVMTIHSSKGLEFDVVVLPLLSQKWNVGTDSLLGHRDTPLGEITTVSRYPSKMMQSINPDLASLYNEALLRQINEELCCLYVATTRAKRSLQMVIGADKEGKEYKPTLCSSSIIREALGSGDDAEPGSILYEHASGASWTEGLQNTGDDPESARQPLHPVTLRVRSSDLPRSARLVSQAPSSMDSEHRVDPRAILRDDSFGSVARDHGHCVHAAFECLNWLDASGFDEPSIRSHLNQLNFSDERIDRTIEEITPALKSPSIARILSRASWIEDHPGSEMLSVHAERPLAVRLEDRGTPRLIQGRLDRLVIARDASGAITRVQIVDFKTDSGATGLSGDALVEYAQKHRPQMDAYRRCVAQMYTLETDLVETVLVYTRAPGTVTLDDA